MSTAKGINQSLKRVDKKAYTKKRHIELWLADVAGMVVRNQGPFTVKKEPMPEDQLSPDDIDADNLVGEDRSAPALNGLQIPVNGVRFLVTSENTPRQHAHTDFNWGKH